MSENYLLLDERPESVGEYLFKYEYIGADRMSVKDSYDYLLTNKGFCLMEKEDGSFILFSSIGSKTYESLQDEELKNLVDSVILPRVLLDKHEIMLGRYEASMLDDLEKTIAKGALLVFEVAGKKTYSLYLEPLRGYDKETSKGLKKIKNAAQSDSLGNTFLAALMATGDEMLSYSSKPVLHIDPEMTLAGVMEQIYSHLIEVMAKNTDGIIEDIDIEFLHDFRVSVRRTRSALSLIRGVYNKDVEKEFRGRFRELGSLTGLARDMDVYLEKIDEYDAMLPEWLRGGMSELGVYFKEAREAEYNKLSDYLLSGNFQDLYDDWLNVVTSKEFISKKGNKEILPIAKKAIYQAFLEIERQADGMSEDTHSDAVHEIRISFKKIRYLLEFYSSLFDKEKITPMLKDMKVLQDSLGDHNDYYVQQLMLEELIEGGKWSAKTASACGFLTAKLAEKQATERRNALHLILAFMRYKSLFGELFR